ncbi:hypothetical protein NLU13_4627 [Sarocladium strictum]|uniref:Uncharacterized protein n=1 Tax=Sarocladium strictum TaxID=5046 RepID=A0AA39L8U5_SARSR|nr:hypothetical protein NLU13_4627 [Sarocladium strictum]
MEVQPPSQAEASADGQEIWDEARLEAAMDRLKLLHIKVRNLRDAIPKMLEPLAKPHPTPDAMFVAFKAAIAESQAAVQDFNVLMNDVRSQQALRHAKESREKDPGGIPPWRHSENPDWFHLDPKHTY